MMWVKLTRYRRPENHTADYESEFLHTEWFAYNEAPEVNVWDTSNECWTNTTETVFGKNKPSL